MLFRSKDLYVENDRIVASEAEVTDKTVIDASGLKAVSYTHLYFTTIIKISFHVMFFISLHLLIIHLQFYFERSEERRVGKIGVITSIDGGTTWTCLLYTSRCV